MRHVLLVLFVCLLAAGAATAQKVENADGVQIPRTDCITENYVELVGPGGEIPDGNPDGAVFGQLQTVDGETIEDVILAVDLIHTWIGDLRVWLLYDTDCDGLAEFVGEVLCRHTLEGCAPDGCCGCSGDLNGVYMFDDTAASIEDECTTAFAPGCYGPDYDSGGLRAFDGLSSGGCFMLYIADGATLDIGTLNAFSVFVLYESTPVDESSWGLIKAMYQ